MVASILASQQPAFRGGGGPVTPVLRSGYSYRIEPSKASTYPGGVFPADAGNIASFTDQITSTVATKTSTAFGTFVANAANAKPGIRFPSAVAYSIPNANVPANFMTQANPRKFCQHIAFTALGATGTDRVFLSFNGANGRISINSGEVTNANAGGCGVFSSSPANTTRINCQDTGVNILSITSTDDVVPGNPGSGLTRIYLNGTCIGVTTAYVNGLGAGVDLIFGSVVAAGTTSSAILTLLDYVYYPDYATPAQVLRDVKAVAYPFAKTLPTKGVIANGPSLTMGTGASAAAYGIVGITNDLLGIRHTPQVHNLGIGGLSNVGMAVLGAEVDELMLEIGAANCALLIGEGYNTLLNGSTSAAQAIDGGGGAGGIGIIGILRARITAGFNANNILLYNITGVGTGRAGFAKYPAYVTGINGIVTSYPELTGITIIDYASDPNVGVATDAVINGGFYGNTVYGANGLGLNGDGYNGLTVGATAGTQGDTVHRSGVLGTVRGGLGTTSGYGIMSDRFICTPVATFLGI